MTRTTLFGCFCLLTLFMVRGQIRDDHVVSFVSPCCWGLAATFISAMQEAGVRVSEEVVGESIRDEII